MTMKKITCALMALLLAVSVIPGCGNEKTAKEEITLIDPVGVTSEYAVVSRRDLVVFKALQGKVVPKVTEVHFSSNQNFSKYGSLPGSDVNPGDPLVYASTKSVDDQIDSLKEKMSDNLENYDEDIKDMTLERSKAKSDMEYASSIVDKMDNMTDAEKKAYGDEAYKKDYATFTSMKASATASYERWDEQIKERTELFDLDRDFDSKSLNRLTGKRTDILATAPSKGKVVAINFLDQNQYINKDTAVGAVGDFNKLEIITDQIFKNEVKRAVEVYAVINGNKYPAKIKEVNAEDKAQDENVETSTSYSTFIIDDPAKMVKPGDYAVIVVVSQKKEDALCIPKDSVSTDTDGAFVYVYNGEKTTYTPIKTGLTSGFYTEVVSGLNEGDRIVSEFKVEKSDKIGEISKGTISNEFSQNGYLWYSKSEWIKNPVEYGTTYIDKLLVTSYQRVEKGEPIAEIRVTPDDINIRRNERTLLRAEEDLADLIKNNDSGSNDKQIKAKNEYIADLKETIGDMKRDSAMVQIVAPYSGIISGLHEFEEGDILGKEAEVAMISSEDDCFVFVEDKSGQLSCGNQASIEYEDANKQKAITTGEVVTVASSALSESLNLGYSLIKVSNEDMAKMSATNQGAGGWWMRSHFAVKVPVRVMNDVLIVPKSAVKIESGVTYVKILDDNNNPEYVSFIPGGSDNLNYWVADGLYEGMKICLE